jgi:Bacterial Ig-like domain/Passenger-associated-transport-repeat
MAGKGGNGGGPGTRGGVGGGSGGDFGMDGTAGGSHAGGGGGGANGGHGGTGGEAGGDGGLDGTVTTPGINTVTVQAGNGQAGVGDTQDGGGGGGGGGHGLIVGAAELSGNSFTNSGNVTAGNGGDGGLAHFAEGGDGGEGGIGIYLTVADTQLDNSAHITGGNGGAGGDNASNPPLALRTGSGGDAGSGVVFSGSGTLINEVGAAITGGNGGRGGIIYLNGNGFNEPPGATGAGVTGAGLIIDNLGTISGGIVRSGFSDASQFESVTFTGGANTMALGSSASFHGAIDLVTSGTTLTFDQGAGNALPDDATLNTTIIGSGSIIKVGTGALTLSATGSTFTGTTDVQAGTLLVDGSIANSTTTVQSGGTLGGHGTVGEVTVQSGGTLAPGNGAGIIHAHDVTFQAGSALKIEIGGTTPGTQYDQIQIDGTATFAGSLDISFINGFRPTVGQIFFLLQNSSSQTNDGAFDGIAHGVPFTTGGVTFSANYEAGTGNEFLLQVQAVQEAPSLVVTTASDVVDANDGLTSLREAITYANAHPGADTITFDASLDFQTINVTSFLPVITDDLVIAGDGPGATTIDGGDQTRLFFVGGPAAGTDVTISNLTLQHGLAKGGDGSGSAGAHGGGGLGAGGAVFVRTGAAVVLDGVEFSENAAQGGAGGARFEDGLVSAGGGGGLGGDATFTIATNAGGGGGGAFENGSIGSGSVGGSGGGPNGGAGGTSGQPSGQAGGDLSGGGGGGVASSSGTGGDGGLGGGGGGGAFQTGSTVSGGPGGNGGFAGGGGGADYAGTPGTGGFGGGGGSAGFGNGAPGGFDGGDGGGSIGGGGAGLGGAVFVMDGASLTITGQGDAFDGSVTGGAGHQSGSAAGSFLFLQHAGVTFAPGAGKTQSIDDTIADDLGNPDANNDGTADDTSAGGGLTLSGGTLILSAINTYHGATTVQSGTLEIDGSIANSAVTVESGAALGGDGTTGVVTVNDGGHLAPGDNRAGVLHTGNLLLSAGSSLDEDMRGDFVAVGGNGYSQTAVTGTVAIHDATLNVEPNDDFVPTPGFVYEIVNNDGNDAVDGTFLGLAEGATFVVEGETLKISYVGGDGNDVTLTDVTPQSGPSITIDTIAGDNVVNAAEGAATITVSGTATGAEDGQTVTLTLKTADGSTTLQTLTTTVSGGAWHLDLPPGATPAFPDGNYLVTADVSDLAGNPATEATRTIRVDTHAPTITINSIAGDNIVTAAEGAGTITVSGTAVGAENGQTVTLTLKTADGSTTLQTLTTTVSGGAWHLDLPPGATPAFPDGNYLVTADVSDLAGNPATEATRTITVDTHAPTITINSIAGDNVVTAAEGAGTITVSGTAAGAEDGQTVTLALKTADGSTTLQTLTTTVGGGLWHLDLPPGATPAFPDGNYLVTADVSDHAGNPATEASTTIRVDAHSDLFTPNNDTVTLPGAGSYSALGGDDTIFLTAAGETVQGGPGNDTFHVDAAGGTVAELVNEGHDTVVTSLPSFILPANVEDLTHTGSVSFSAAGNDLDNVITGGDGNDYLAGFGGNDTFIDTSGLNTFQGGTGDDTYFVTLNTTTVFEFANEGIDRVITTLNAYTLPANVENVLHIGDGDFTATGNDLNNIIAGGGGNDHLNGGAGNDYLIGGAGNDTFNDPSGLNTFQGGDGDDNYFVNLPTDTVFEFPNEGNDTVITTLSSYFLPAEVENLTFTGASAHTGTGNTGNNVFTASAGTDAFTGAGGNDVFKFSFSTGNQVTDIINDFNADNSNASEHDHIDLSGRGLSFTALTLTDTPDGVTIGIPGGDAIHLKNVAGHSIDAGDFFF